VLPSTNSPYGRWVNWLDGFAAGTVDSPEGLPAIDPEQLGATVTSRLAQKVGNAVNRRLDLWRQSLERELHAAREIDDLSAALQAARRRATPLRSFAQSPLLFPELRESLQSGVSKALTAGQEALERSARGLGSRDENLLRAVRAIGVDQPLELDFDSPSSPSAAGRRSVLLR
jgi:hypothetical protein